MRYFFITSNNSEVKSNVSEKEIMEMFETKKVVTRRNLADSQQVE